MNIQLWEILVPVSSHEKPFSYEYHKEWDKKVRDIAGGLTILRSGKGEWVSPSGEIVVERVIPVRIACTEEQIEQILTLTITHYDQEAVMAYKVSDCVLLRFRE